MKHEPPDLTFIFSCVGHAYIHLFTAFYFVIVLALEKDRQMPFHELLELWALGALLVRIGACPVGWLGDRWSPSGMGAVSVGAGVLPAEKMVQPASRGSGRVALATWR